MTGNQRWTLANMALLAACALAAWLAPPSSAFALAGLVLCSCLARRVANRGHNGLLSWLLLAASVAAFIVGVTLAVGSAR